MTVVLNIQELSFPVTHRPGVIAGFLERHSDRGADQLLCAAWWSQCLGKNKDLTEGASNREYPFALPEFVDFGHFLGKTILVVDNQFGRFWPIHSGGELKGRFLLDN